MARRSGSVLSVGARAVDIIGNRIMMLRVG